MNPFHTERSEDPAAEDAAREFFSPLADAAPSPEATALARERLFEATTAPSVRTLPLRHRFALAVAAIVAPLLAVSAVGALTGNDSLNTPVEVVSNAAKAVGIGGKSADHRQDVGHRNDQSGDNGQPGSCPGNSCNAPGHSNHEATNSATGSAGAIPPAHGSAAPQRTPHDNGHGCDDKLFAEGTPPFGGHDTPVGPCGAKQASGETGPENTTPRASQTPHPTGNGNGNANKSGGTVTAPASITAPGNSGGHGNSENSRDPNK
jgi:hypothetical protein